MCVCVYRHGINEAVCVYVHVCVCISATNIVFMDGSTLMAASAGDKPLIGLLPGVSRLFHTHAHTHRLLARGCTLPTAYRGPQVNTMKERLKIRGKAAHWRHTNVLTSAKCSDYLTQCNSSGHCVLLRKRRKECNCKPLEFS